MKARQFKKQEIQAKQQELAELEIVLSAHWERQITKAEAEEILEEILIGFGNTDTRNMQIIDDLLEKNKLNNNRFWKRKKMFSAESLAIKLFSGAEALAK